MMAESDSYVPRRRPKIDENQKAEFLFRLPFQIAVYFGIVVSRTDRCTPGNETVEAVTLLCQSLRSCLCRESLGVSLGSST